MTESLTLREEAQWMNSCLCYGLISKQEIIAWADAHIEAHEAPDPQVVEIAMAGNQFTDDVLRLLEGVRGRCESWKVRTRLFRTMRRSLVEDEDRLQQVAHILFRMAVNGDAPCSDAEARMFAFDNAVALALDGICGSPDTIRIEILAFLDRWAAWKGGDPDGNE